MTRPLAADLFCGLGGFTAGFLAEGWDCVGFDIEQHVYGEHRYPAQLVLQNVLTLQGSQLRDAACIVASPPCTEFSYLAMPWSRGKQIARALRGEGEFPVGYTGSRTISEMTALFDACFRIQREASEAAGRHIPMVVENVCGAQPWVGRAKWHYGSYYLFGDVPALMPIPTKAQKFNPDGSAHGVGSWFAIADSQNRGASEGVKVGGLDWNKRVPGQAFNSHAERATKNTGGSWFNVAHDTTSGTNNHPARGEAIGEGTKVGGKWFRDSTPGAIRSTSSKSTARKAASARIAMIPFSLSSYLARVYKPV